MALMQLIEHGPEDRRPLDVVELLTKIVNDIPADCIDLPNESDISEEWETLAVVMRIAVLSKQVDVRLMSVADYVPKQKTKIWLAHFCRQKEKGLMPMLSCMMDTPLIV